MISAAAARCDEMFKAVSNRPSSNPTVNFAAPLKGKQLICKNSSCHATQPKIYIAYLNKLTAINKPMEDMILTNNCKSRQHA